MSKRLKKFKKLNLEIKRASRNRGPKAFEDTHTIAGIWIKMVFCKIKLGYGCQFTNPGFS